MNNNTVSNSVSKGPIESVKESINFEKIPNELIQYSIRYNPSMLCVYCYILFNKNLENKVTTNIDIISNLYDLTFDKRYNRKEEYKSGLKDLSIDIGFKLNNEDITLYRSVDIIQNDEDSNILIVEIDNRRNIVNNFTVLEYKEFQYIIGYLYNRNKIIYANRKNKTIEDSSNNLSSLKKINSIILFNIYLYLKMIINKNSFFEKTTTISINKLSEITNTSRKVITQYINILEDLGLIKVIKQNKVKTANIIELSNDWRKQINE